ncbi:polysaccharide biosynthesis/export family protein [Phreatobacter sp.]|uniref:polysaccharide biosynthesis/export family protein n=1 Tax=Phreatobacter sp. TaxID=1966341 RepID=UPI003F7218A3
MSIRTIPSSRIRPVAPVHHLLALGVAGCLWLIAPALAQQPGSASPPASQIQATGYAVGDRLRVSVFEQLEAPMGAGNQRSRDTLRAFYQRVDLGGEYSVEADGALNLPLLGRIPVAGRSAAEVRQDIANALQKETGRLGDVHIAILERQPVYVVGHVRQPGSFRFAPGMIAIQAIALAGGAERTMDRSLTPVDASRERERAGVARSRLASLLARRSVLQSAHNRSTPEIPEDLVGLVGAGRARELVETETAARERAAEERTGEIRRLSAVLAAAREELSSLRSAADQSRRLAAARQAEIARVSEPDPRLTNAALLASLQAEAADFTLKNRQFAMAASQVEQRIAEATGELTRVELQFRSQLARDLVVAEEDIASLQEALASAGIIADQIQSQAGSQPANQPIYQIVRQTLGQPQTLTAQATTLLQPGDVVQVTLPPLFRTQRRTNGARP